MSQHTAIGLLLVASLLIGSSDTKIVSRCEIAELWLKLYGLDLTTVGTLVCIALAESDLNLDAVNSDSGDYGLYQINNMYW